MSQTTNDRIKLVLSAIFSVEPSAIDEAFSPDTVKSWDSLKHMNLITALEEEFDIRFDDQEIVALMSYPMIVDTVAGKMPEA